MRKKLMNIKDITFDKEFYPRNDYNWLVAYNYSNAMKSGSKFPEITIAQYKGKNILIDGKHRLEAYKLLKQKYVSVEIIKIKDKADIFIEAVKRNIKHGYQFSPKDKAEIVLKLKHLKVDKITISNLIKIPADKLNKFVADRLANDITGKDIILKSPLKHLAGQDVGFGDKEQDIFSSNTQAHIINELINLISNNLIDFKNKTVIAKLKLLKKLLNNIKLK